MMGSCAVPFLVLKTLFVVTLLLSPKSFASIDPDPAIETETSLLDLPPMPILIEAAPEPPKPNSKISVKKQIPTWKSHASQIEKSEDTSGSKTNSLQHSPAFDLPVTYNAKVKSWIRYYQTNGRKDFKRWMERSSRYLPKITEMLEKQGLPEDLVYLAMIESGFNSKAVSSAAAVGYWQFIAPTASRYGLRISWWLDERRDIVKSTIAAANYLNDLFRMFNSWYLAAAAYNMGEGRVKRLIKKYQTTNYWVLSQKSDFPDETENYIPKLIAAMLIAKSPALYGFRDLKPQPAIEYDFFYAPGGTDLHNLAASIGVDKNEVERLNPELIKGFVPGFVNSHRVRIPKGHLPKVAEIYRPEAIRN